MKRLSLFLVSILLFLSTQVFAETRLGIVDLQKIMQQSSQLKDIQANLERDFKPRRDNLMAAESKIKEAMEKLKRDSSVLSDKQRKEEEKRIISEQQKFEREGQQYQQELSKAHNEQMEKLYNKIREGIAVVAKKNKYDVILQKEAVPYSNDSFDITSEVLKEVK